MDEPYEFNEYDLADIFKEVFGYTAFPYLFGLQNKAEAFLRKKFGKDKEKESEYNFKENKFDNYSEYQFQNYEAECSINGEPYYADNDNGHRMFLPVWLSTSNDTKSKLKGKEILLQNTVSSFTNKKNIVETALVNRQGTVKELISIDDWDINIKGLIVSTTPDYPDAKVQELVELYELEEPLQIRNVRSSITLRGQEQVVIKSLTFPEIKGKKRIQAFEMDLTSDIPFSLILDNN